MAMFHTDLIYGGSATPVTDTGTSTRTTATVSSTTAASTRAATEGNSGNAGYIDTSIDDVDLAEDYIEWNYGKKTISKEQFDNYLDSFVNSRGGDVYGINTDTNVRSFNKIADTLSGIFGMPYQFHPNVDPVVSGGGNIGRKYDEKIFSLMPVLFLSPGEPKFMAGYGQKAKSSILSRLAGRTDFDGDSDNNDKVADEGRYYSFQSNFKEYKKYANVALRALALFMGIQNVTIPVPGDSGRRVKLGNIDIEGFMNSEFTRLFGTQQVVPFFLDAETSISESFSNSTTESMIAQSVNGFSQTAREVQFLMGSGETNSILGNLKGAVTDATTNIIGGIGELGELVAGKNMISRIANELTTVVTGGKIVFPEIWSESSYDKSYSVNLKLRSPDPDPVSIFLNIYMPIILLVCMAAPRQVGNSSNSYEAPFLVRATYKSFFSIDLGIISALNINYGGQAQFNVMGQPITADVQIDLRDMYHTMMVSKRMGLVTNTAQLDYLCTLAGIDMNDYEPLRVVKLWAQILGDTPRDWANDMWGGVKRILNRKASEFLGNFTDTRFIR